MSHPENGRLSRVLLAGAAVHFLLQVFGHDAYGLFRDELYYLACASRPALGYVDHPPFSLWALALNRAVLGDSLFAMRLLPALLGSATVVLAGLFARRLGGGRLAQALAGLAVVLAPIYLIVFGFFSMNAIEVFLWALSSYVVMLSIRRREPRLWLAFGALAGIGLLNKHTMVLLGAGLAVGLVLTPERRRLAERWIWLAGLLAFVLVLPNLVWQQANGWPSLEFYKNATQFKNVETSPLVALFMQVLVQNPGTLPLILAGLYFYFRDPSGRPYRLLGWAWLVLFVLLVFSGASRPDRIAGSYPMLFAAGAVVLERWIRKGERRWAAVALTAAIAIFGLLLLPISSTVLPPSVSQAYMGAMGGLLEIEKGKSPPLPQWLSDRIGWKEMADAVADVYDSLPPEDREKALVYATNYGRAGALELYGTARGLPRVVSGHNSYYLWSAEEGTSTEVLIAVSLGEETLERLFEDVVRAGETRCDGCMPYENGVPIFVARRPKVPLDEVWERFKHYE